MYYYLFTVYLIIICDHTNTIKKFSEERKNEFFCCHLLTIFLFLFVHILVYFISQNLAIASLVCLIYKAIVYSLQQYANAFEQLIRATGS